MFDKLVESTTQKTKGRNQFYLVTSLIYGTALSALAVATIIWFNPAMAEANTVTQIIAPPPLPDPDPMPEPLRAAPTPPEIWAAPVKPPETIADASQVPPRPPEVIRRTGGVAGVPNLTDVSSIGTGIPRSQIGESSEPPPPPPTPAPTPKATPAPEPRPNTPDIVRLPSTMITGKAIHKAQPPYPQMAKAIRAQGTVPVQITISEEGRVLQATAVGGNPTLQDAAQKAALQWVFSPTILNGKAVKVTGVISFNFILN
jgi:protein TonB